MRQQPSNRYRHDRAPRETGPEMDTVADKQAHAGFSVVELLTDVEKTAFFFVTLPEALPIAVITRCSCPPETWCG